MVSTASRVGTGNIVGVATAICLGGAGSVFWMWVMCIIGAASAFMESTLAQIFKRVDKDGGYYGGPAYYIEMAMHSRVPAFIFSLFLILTYAFGFNLLASYNLQSTFMAYSWYGHWTKIAVGAVLALLTGYCLMGGGKRIVHLTEVVVPVMGILYVLLSLLVLILNIKNIPAMFVDIFTDAFNFKAIFGGIAGSCLVLGIKRGLFSNEAGVGSAPSRVSFRRSLSISIRCFSARRQRSCASARASPTRRKSPALRMYRTRFPRYWERPDRSSSRLP